MSDQERTPVLEGGCQCGAIRYRLTATPQRVHLCHCRMCQKAMGNAFGAFAPVRVKDFAWTRGMPASFASSSLADRYFCARCGTPLGFHYHDGEWIAVTIGSLDRPQDVAPEKHFGVESRLGWLQKLADLPTETILSAMPDEQKAKLINYQHPDHETPPEWLSR